MRKVKIITDSTASLPKKTAEEHGIEVIPARIVFGAKGYPDDGTISAKELFEFTESAGALPQSVAVHEYQFQETFQKWLAEDYDILFIGISSKMAETVNNASAAAAKLAGGRISIVDSFSISSGMALLALEAADLAERGADLQAAALRVYALRDKVRASIVFQTLKYVYMGGRCSRFASFMVGAMNIKPMANVADGEMVPGEGFKGKNYIDKFVELVMQDPERIDPKRIFVTHCLFEDAEMVRDKIVNEYGFKNVMVCDASPATSVYGGPGSIGIMYLYK